MHWQLIHPRYWSTWFGLLVLRLCTPLPYSLLMLLGRLLGRSVRHLPISYVRVAQRNLELCFPHLSSAAQQKLLTQHFQSLGMAIFETGIAWWGSNSRIIKLTVVQGMEHLQTALTQGRGAILLSAHFTTLEMGARAMAARIPLNIMYRPTGNPVMAHFLARNRAKHTRRAIPRDDIRTLITALKANEVVWYAPDQSYRKKGAQMVPFFNIPAASNTATSRLAKMTGAAVLPYFVERLDHHRGYQITIQPALEAFPSTDPVADTARFNQLIETQIARVPAQYLWIHKRFKGLSATDPNYYQHIE